MTSFRSFSLAWMTCAALFAIGTLNGCKGKSTNNQNETPQCHTRADCQGGEICTAGTCSPCSRDRDCNRNELCRPDTRLCALMECFGNDCKLNSDCPLGQFCVQGLCLTPPTTNNCPVVTCTQDKDCNIGQICDPANLVCIQNLGCSTDADCGAGLSCNTGDGQCVPSCTTTTAASVCGITQVCSNGRCVDCVKNSDCGVGLTCDQMSNTCVAPNSCTTTRDCMIPLVCNQATQSCTVQPPECLSAEDCPMGETCITETGQCVTGTCLPDRYEPNETLDQAAPIMPGTLSNLTLCQNTTTGQNPVAFFKLHLNAGDFVDVYVNVDTLLNFNIAILDGTGTPISQPSNTPSQFDATAYASVSGDYFIEASSTDSFVDYGLKVTVTPGMACASNDTNNTYATATTEKPGDLFGQQICPGDIDWFLIGAKRGQTVTAVLDTTPTDGIIDIALYDSNGQTLLAGSTNAMAEQTVSTNSFTGAGVYVKVYGDDPSVRNTYDLHLTVQ